MQTGLTAAQEAKLKAFVTENTGNVTDDDVASFAREFMTPVAIVLGFVDYFNGQLVVEPAKKEKAPRKAKQTDDAEAAQDALEPAGADVGDSAEPADSLEPVLFDE